MGNPGPSRLSRMPPWLLAATRVVVAVAFLYVFLVGIKALETGISMLGGGYVDRILGTVATPIAGVAAGMLTTVLVQSSSVTTSALVGLVAAGVLPLESAVFMVMGANIGTTVTNTLASLGHLRQGAYFQRAFAAATVHDYFNLLSVALLLPLEVAFGLVSGIATRFADAIDGMALGGPGGSSPIKTAISAAVDLIKQAIEAIDRTEVQAGVMLAIGVVLIFVGLWVITRQMKKVLSSRMETSINRVLSKGGGAPAMLAGLGITVAVQSSSITTSILVPIAAAGVITLQNAYPVTLGANIGTTITALLASIATDSPDALALALAHTTFNVLGVLIFYPIPQLRRIPILLADFTANVATRRKSLVLAYVVGVFIVAPLIVLFVS